MPGIEADLLPAAHHVEPRGQRFEEAREFLGIVLQVGVEGHDDVALGGLEAGGEGSRLAEVAAKPDSVDPTVLARQLSDDVPGAVGAAVVHEDDFQVESCRGGDGFDLGMELRQAVALVADGDDDRDHAAVSFRRRTGGPGSRQTRAIITTSAAVHTTRRAHTDTLNE